MRVLKILSAVAGIGALIVSAALVVGGATILTATGDDGFTQVPTLHVTNPAAGVVADDIDLYLDRNRNGFTISPGEFRVLADIESSKDVFVGIGPDHEVMSYLEEAGYTQTRFRGDEVRLTVPEGSVAGDPSDQDFWLATNADASLDWTVTEGDYAFVIVNRDGSAGLDLSIDGAVRVPFLRPIGGALLGIGIVMAVAGLALVYFGLRREDPPPPPEPEGVTPLPA
jgi:hypothetical protein